MFAPQWKAVHSERMITNGLLVTSGFLASGALAGHAARRLLARLRRGAVFRPPGCELFTAIASAIVGWRFAAGALPGWWCAVPLLLAWLAVPLAAVDLVALRLPNALTYAAYPTLGAALLIAAACGPDHDLAVRAVLGSAVFGGAHALVRWFAPKAIGAGDVKLAGSLGAVLGALGWSALALATALAATITLVLAATQPTKLPAPLQPPPRASTDPAPTDPAPAPVEPAPAQLPAPPHLSADTPLPAHQPTDSPAPTAPTAPTAPSDPADPVDPVDPVVDPSADPSIPARRPIDAPPPAHHLADSPIPAHPKEPPPAAALRPQQRHAAQPTSARSRSAPGRTPLLRRAVPHGPGLLAATWLLATFPGQALIGGVIS